VTILAAFLAATSGSTTAGVSRPHAQSPGEKRIEGDEDGCAELADMLIN
jgi:hypothetical protein